MGVVMSSLVSTSVLAAPAMTVSVPSCLNFSYLYIGEGDVNFYVSSQSRGKLFSVITKYDLMWHPAFVTLPTGSCGLRFIAFGRDAAVFIYKVKVIAGECPLAGE